ncbi:MAG: YrbL family protein [Hyphomicrobiales bacterium]
MIVLSENAMIAKGSMRGCYHHPDRNDLCIKVDLPETHKPATLHEIQFLNRIKRIRRKRPFEAIAQYYGSVETNLGLGAVFELVADKDTQNVSEIFMNLLLQASFEEHLEKYQTALLDFKSRFLKDAVIARDIRPWNLCAQRQKDRSIRLKLIDGMGHRYFIPIYDYIPPLARRRITLQFEKSGFSDVTTLREKYANDPSNKWAGTSNAHISSSF